MVAVMVLNVKAIPPINTIGQSILAVMNDCMNPFSVQPESLSMKLANLEAAVMPCHFYLNYVYGITKIHATAHYVAKRRSRSAIDEVSFQLTPRVCPSIARWRPPTTLCRVQPKNRNIFSPQGYR